MKVQFIKIHPDAKLPTKAHEDDAGMDFYAVEDIYVDGGRIREVKTGLVFQINVENGYVPQYYTYYLQLKDKSSMAMQGLHLFAGVVDIGYRGEITGVMYNSGATSITIRKGQKAFQGVMLLIPMYVIEEVKEVLKSERGEEGFGSSGRY